MASPRSQPLSALPESRQAASLLIRKYFRRIAVSSETSYALLARTLQGVMMLAAGAAVVCCLSLDQQGYFFSFMSFGALLQMGDFGLSYAVLNNANHLSSIGQRSRLAGLFSRAIWLNCGTSLLLAVVVGLTGFQVFSAGRNTSELTRLVWLYPWISFVCAMFLAQLTAPGISFVEGGISVVAAWRFRFLQELLSGPVLILLFSYGFGLWSLVLFWISRFVVSATWLWMTKPPFDAATSFTWREWYTEVWPFQWKMGLSALSGFLVFQAINPIVLAEQGLKAAGQFGFSLAIMNMVLMVTTVWPISKAAHYANLLSTRQFQKLRRSFREVTLLSTLFAFCSAMGISIILWWFTHIRLPHVDRLADWFTTTALLATGVLHHIVCCFAVLLRAERREPLLWVSVIGGMLTLPVLWIPAHYGKPQSIAATNLCCTFVGLLLVYFIYQRRVALWKPGIELSIESCP
jgi:hypothetical protein